MNAKDMRALAGRQNYKRKLEEQIEVKNNESKINARIIKAKAASLKLVEKIKEKIKKAAEAGEYSLQLYRGAEEAPKTPWVSGRGLLTSDVTVKEFYAIQTLEELGYTFSVEFLPDCSGNPVTYDEYAVHIEW